jgi:hypothetical protein
MREFILGYFVPPPCKFDFSGALTSLTFEFPNAFHLPSDLKHLCLFLRLRKGELLLSVEKHFFSFSIISSLTSWYFQNSLPSIILLSSHCLDFIF